jgi:hypothetical protein
MTAAAKADSDHGRSKTRYSERRRIKSPSKNSTLKVRKLSKEKPK